MPWKEIHKFIKKILKKRDTRQKSFRKWGGLYGKMYWESVEKMVGGFNEVEKREFEKAHTNYIEERKKLGEELGTNKADLFKRFGNNSEIIFASIANLIRTSMGPNIRPIKRANLLLSGKPKRGMRLNSKMRRRIPIVTGTEIKAYENSVSVPLGKKPITITYKVDPNKAIILIKPKNGKEFKIEISEELKERFIQYGGARGRLENLFTWEQKTND